MSARTNQRCGTFLNGKVQCRLVEGHVKSGIAEHDYDSAEVAQAFPNRKPAPEESSQEEAMSRHEIVAKLRNPYGLSPDEIRQVRLAAATLIESLHGAYSNMRQFAEDNGLDTVCRNEAAVNAHAAVDGLVEALQEMLRWESSGFAPQSKANAVMVARAALASVREGKGETK